MSSLQVSIKSKTEYIARTQRQQKAEPKWKKWCYFTTILSLQIEGAFKGKNSDSVLKEMTYSKLAQYIVEDMRLLMVGRVSILNKKMMNEKLKRQTKKEKLGRTD